MPKLQRWYKGLFYVNGNKRQLKYQIEKIHDFNELTLGVPVVHEEYGVGRYQGVVTLKVNELEDKYLIFEYATHSKLYLPLSSLHLINRFISIDPEHTPLLPRLKKRKNKNFEVYETHTHNIPYQPKPVGYDNPFDFITSSPHPSSSLADNEEIYRRYERLLYWLSAIGDGSRESFKIACQSLELAEPRRILRRLKLLGHLESSADGSRWTMSPTALVKTKSQEFVLCGQRSLKLVQRLEQLAKVTSINQRRCPPCIYLKLASKNVSYLIEHAEFSISDAGKASSKLAKILPDIETWQQNLRNLQGIEPSLYEWQYFDDHHFVDCVSPNKTGLYQFVRREANNNMSRTVFYDQPNNRWLQGDWYGLRFLALYHNQDISCIVHYNKTTENLAIPLDQRWPEIYERALVLASGQLPTYQRTEQSWWLVYERITPKLATQLTDKLGVRLHNND